MIRALALILMLTPGTAMAIQPDCFGSALAAQEAGQGEYNVLSYPNGLVLYRRAGDPWGVEVVLEHCPSRDRVSATLFPVPDAEAVEAHEAQALEDIFINALDSARTYTFSDLALLAREAGANIWQGRVSYQSCACRTYDSRAPRG